MASESGYRLNADTLNAHHLQPGQPLLQAGSTCWRRVKAGRFALLADGASYLPAMRAAIENARQSILLLGWDFDPRVPLDPGAGDGSQESRLCDIIARLVFRRPDLRVNILIWDMTFAYAVQRRDRPQHGARWLPASVQYRLDARHPVGASHHQKILVVDDAVAFCGGSDFTRNRWDTPEHLSNDTRRRMLDGGIYGPRHEVMAAVDGDAAAALADVVRDRWRRVCGVSLPAVVADADPWPQNLAPDIADAVVGISRTMPPCRGEPEVREVEALNLRAIALARHWIYLENQYITSPSIRDALARRLVEPDGPEIVIVCPLHSGGRADRLAMDRPRSLLIGRLRAIDRHHRFRAYAPMTATGEAINVHSKVMVVDDRLFQVGSANLNNRSLGLDSECDISVEADADGDETAPGILRLLCRLVSEHVGCETQPLEQEIRRSGSLLAGIDALACVSGRRLQELEAVTPGLFDRFVAHTHLLDPTGVADNWRPWRRAGR